MANRNFASGGKIYSMHVKPVLIDCNFVVDSTNSNGLGIRSLKGPLVSNVFMHTSATPVVNNPNPQAGVIVVQLSDNYNRYLSGFSGQASAPAAPSASVTAGKAYVLASVGTATQAQLVASGLNINIPSAPGVAFIASVTASLPGGATAMTMQPSGIDHIEVVGNPNVSLASTQPQIQGGQIILQCLLNTTVTAPIDGSVISLAFYLNDSSVQIQGE
jgi:hypothetical protein